MRGIVSRSGVLAILTVAAFLFGSGGAAMAQSLTIMHTNDMHSHLLGYGPNGEYTPMDTTDNDPTLGGLARIAGKVNDIRDDRPADTTLLVDAGDFMMGSAFVFLRGAAELQVMDAMGYDVLTLGNHEFDWTSAGTALILSNIPGYSLDLPVVASNLTFDPDDPGDDALEALFGAGVVQEYYIKTVNGVDVGFFGLVGENAADVAPLAAPVVFDAPAVAAQAMVTALQGAGADLIVCLSHSGLDEDSALAATVPGIDVIISGHTHEKTDTGPITVGTTLIVQAGAYTRYLGVLDLDLSAPAPHFVSYDLVAIDDCIEPEVGTGCVPADGPVNTLVEGLESAVDGELASEGYGYTFSQVIAETAFDLRAIDGEEGNLGNLITDAMRWMVDQYETVPTDIAIESNGVIRDNILSGTPPLDKNIAFSDAFAAVPLGAGLDGAVGYPMLSFYLTGAELKKALELIVIAYPMMGGDYWLNVSGLRYEYMTGGIPLNSVTKVEIGNETTGYVKLNKKWLYKVAINFYVAQFIDGIPALIDGLIGVPGIGQLLAIIPKDSSGVPIENLADARVDTDPVAPGVQELQEWEGLMEYFGTFDDLDTDGVPDVPDLYSGPTGRITLADCFVATAAYGSPLEEKVDVLRDFRDRVLMKSSPGRAFVDFYYTHGPALARTVAQSEWLRAMVRILLLPLVGVAKLVLLLL